jgi:6-phosphogluconate dehydrogenase
MYISRYIMRGKTIINRELGYIGLGKMGLNMVERLLEKGYAVTVFDKDPESVQRIARKGAKPASTLQQLASSLKPPRLIWIMVPYQAVDSVIQELLISLIPGDVLIDGGNSPYKESIRRAEELEARGIHFLDAGVSGGPSGARIGACIMVGGEKEVFEYHKNLFRDLSVKKGFGYMGKSGAGHFVKMVHNGIEYGMMQAVAEGFSVLKASPFHLDLTKISDLYNHKSVIESRLTGWLRQAFEKYGEDLESISGSVSHTGEGAWTVEIARESGIPVPIIEEALNFRIQSGMTPSYTGKILSALRNQFGGHEVTRKAKK